MTFMKNKSFKNYMVYCLRDSLLRNLIVAIIAVIYLLTNLQNATSDYYDCKLHLLTLILVALSLIMPIFSFSEFNNKRNLDTIYSLPMSRKSISLAHYLRGAASLFFVYSVCYAVYVLHLISSILDYHIGSALIYYLLSLVYGIAMYTFFTFIFTKANTSNDGLVFCFSWSYIAALLLIVIFLMIYKLTDFDDIPDALPLVGSILSPIIYLNGCLSDYIEINRFSQDSFHPFNDNDVKLSVFFGYPLWIIISIVCVVLFFKSFPNKAAEKAEDISTSIFGYKFLIPVTGFSLSYVVHFAVNSNVLLLTIIFIGMVINYFIYRRGFKLKKSDLFFLAIALLYIIIS